MKSAKEMVVFQKRNHDLTCTIVLLLTALIAFLPLAQLASNPNTFEGTYQSIDSKVETVMMLTAASTIASSAITAIPDDFGTPIAEQIAEFTDYLLIILSVLLTEKYLLTILGMVSFRILIPAAFILSIPCIKRRVPVFQSVAKKMAAMMLVLFLVIPISMGISDMIWDTFQVSIDNTIASVESLSAEEATEPEETNFISSMWSKMSGAVTSFADGITHLPERATAVMNNFIQSIAVMIVTACIIPLLVLVFAVWIVKQFTGVNVPLPDPHRRHHRHSRIPETVDEEEDTEALVTV